MDIDRMVESHFKKKRDIFGFESIAQLIEEVMDSMETLGVDPTLLREQPRPGEERRARPTGFKGKAEPQTLRLPVSFPTEISVGQDPTSKDREAFEIWMSKIPGSNLAGKVQAIEQFLTDPPEGSIAQTLSFLMFLNSFAYILKEFNASVAGFLWEPFLAGLIGGKASMQVPTSAGDIADVKLEGERFSLKILRPDGDVGGSFVDLVKHFEQNPDEAMTYYVIKKMEGEKMTFFQFTISQETFFNFIGHPKTEAAYDAEEIPFTLPKDKLGVKRTKDPATGEGTVVDVPWPERGYASWSQAKAPVRNLLVAADLLPKGSKMQKITLPDGSPVKKLEPGQKLVVHVDAKKTVAGKAGPGADLTANAKHLWGKEYEAWYSRRQDPNFWTLVADPAKGAPGFRKNRQFEIGWNYALSNELVKDIGTIDISKASLDAAFAKGASTIGVDLTSMFNALTDLVDNVGKFFLMDCGEDDGKCTQEDLDGRMDAGKSAISNSATLKQVVDTKIAPQLKEK